MRKLKIRVAKYKRVSTDEQKLKKNSIIAQDEILNEYIKNNPDFVLVGDFSDEGVSGSKIKRTELQRLLEKVENDEVDLIIVTKLDRWFRNVAFYYRVQEILEKNNVAWKTVLEDYNTLTADGKLKVNIMLSVAQNEVERTSERIKVVFESKIKRKQVVSGAVPFGFKVVEGNGAKTVVKDPKTQHVVEEILELMAVKKSVRAVCFDINKKYEEYQFKYDTLLAYLHRPILYGHHHGVDDFCEGYMTKEQFDKMQKDIRQGYKFSSKKRTYLFTGLMTCPSCHHAMAGYYTTLKRGSKSYNYKRYRCGYYYSDKTCDMRTTYSEARLERQLLKQLKPRLQEVILEAEVKESTPAPRINVTAVKEEIKRLNTMYQKGRIDDEEYDEEYDRLQAKLDAKPAQKKDYTELKKLLDTDILSLYETFNDEEKQIFWRSIVDKIEIVDNKEPIIFFS